MKESTAKWSIVGACITATMSLIAFLSDLLSIGDKLGVIIDRASTGLAIVLTLLEYVLLALPFVMGLGSIYLAPRVPWQRARWFYLIISLAFLVTYALIALTITPLSAADWLTRSRLISVTLLWLVSTVLWIVALIRNAPHKGPQC
jgi:hypothetical protein